MKIKKINVTGNKNRAKYIQGEIRKLINEHGENYEKVVEFEKLEKKMLKVMYNLHLNKQRDFQEIHTDNLINHFRKYDDYDSWTDVYIFGTNDLETVKNELEEMYVSIEGYNLEQGAYDCTGRPFGYECNFKVYENRTYVTQNHYLDV